MQSGEEIAAGLGLAAVACYATEFVPFWAGLIALCLSAGAVFSVKRDFYPVARRTAFGVFAVFMAFHQPWAGLALCGAAAVFAGFIAWDNWLSRVGTSALVALATFAGAVAAYTATATFVLPWLHPLTVMLYDIGPLIAVGTGVLVTLYCAWRLRAGEEDEEKLFYRLAPGLCAVLFALFFPMKNSWTGLGAEWLFAAVTFGLAFRSPRLLFVAGTATGALFAGAFLLMNGSTTMHNIAMAESMRVHEVQRLPATRPNRIMPIVVGGDFCVQGNDGTMTGTGAPHAQIIGETFYWQCPTHYTGFQLFSPLSWIPGSTAGFVLVNAGSTASDTVVNNHGFIFGEDSFLVRSAFMAGHPNGTITGFTYAANRSGNYRLLITYTQNKLFWGAMVPVAGVMSVNQFGFTEDYTIEAAAREFPGSFLYPAELARRYADAWGTSTIGKILSRTYLEVSEPPQVPGNLSNPLPYGIDTEAGRKYFIPYEPQGKHGTAMSDIAFFDGASGDSDVIILHVADSDQAGERTALGHRSIQGPKELLEKSGNVVQGHFQLTSIEPIIVVTRSGRIYFITANLGPDKTKSNHDYQGDTLSFATGEPQWVITSSADAQRLIDAHEKSLEATGQGTAAPAPKSTEPKPTESKPSESRATQSNSADFKPTDSKPAEPTPAAPK